MGSRKAPGTVPEQDHLTPWLESEEFKNILASNGWRQLNAGRGRSEDYNTNYLLFTRTRPLTEVANIDGTGDSALGSQGQSGVFPGTSQGISRDNLQKCPRLTETEMAQPCGFQARAQIPVGAPQTGFWAHRAEVSQELPRLASFSGIKSLNGMQSEKMTLAIGFDSEWVGEGPRRMLSWQFAFVWNQNVVELVFLAKGPDVRISPCYAIGRIMDFLQAVKPQRKDSVLSYAYYISDTDDAGKVQKIKRSADSAEEARRYAEYAFLDGEISDFLLSDLENHRVSLPAGKRLQRYIPYIDRGKFTDVVPVTLVYHAGQADLSTFARDMDGSRNSVLRYLTNAQGGLFSMYPVDMFVPSAQYVCNSGYLYRVSVSFRDSMCFAGGDMKSLDALGKVVGVRKIDVPKETKCHMDILLTEDPVMFMNYAAQDAVVSLLYSNALFGYNREMPCTITGIAAKAAKEACMEYLKCNSQSEFDNRYRGIRTEKMGLVKVPDDNGRKPNFLRATKKAGLNDKARRLQMMASSAFHGGYNSSSLIGYFPEVTFDIDLKSAYPTAMCLIPDVNWEDSIAEEIHNRELTLTDFHLIGGHFNPVAMLFCYCKFEFPESVKFPCLPYVVDKIPVFPRTSICRKLNEDYVYACGPELYLALRLGARVYVETGYCVRTLLTDKGESYSVAYAMKRLVEDRGIAELLYGKGSLQEQTLKVMNNAVYGKIAQAVVDKRTWDAYSGDMEILGPSAITNPVTAAMITSIVRATLLAAMNQAYEKGYRVYSVTTDGFITNMPLEELSSLDLYGLKAALSSSRRFLTDDKDESIWSIKHAQDDLVNFSTRGNVSLYSIAHGNPFVYNGKEYDGVIARNGAKSPYEKKSMEDRRWIMTEVLGRTGKVHCSETSWTPFKDLAGGKDFIVLNQEKDLSMDFDMKRMPDKASFYTEYPVVTGSEYEIACFDTVPFETIDDFIRYRAKAQNAKCLRTEEDWTRFWINMEKGDSMQLPGRAGGQYKIRDLRWSILNSCVMGYRAGLWDIPYLNTPGLTVAEKCAWIQGFNRSGSKIFKVNDWKHAGEAKRQKNILPEETIKDLLMEMQKAVL